MEDEDHNLAVCKLVADAINRTEGTDFYPAPAPRQTAADVLLKSSSCKLRDREVQLVRLPIEFTNRYNSDNFKKLNRTLHSALEKLGVSESQVMVGWTEWAKRSATRYCAPDYCIGQMAELIASKFPLEGGRCIGDDELYDYSPRVSEVAHFINITRLKGMKLIVLSPACTYLPKNDQWIREALSKKIGKYGNEIERRMILVIDGEQLLDREQISAFRASFERDSISFTAVWAVTMGKAYRLKPAPEVELAANTQGA